MKQEIKDIIKEKTKHIGFIVDGNGRWAKSRNLPRSVGHDHGFKALEKIVKSCFYDFNIQIVSAYVFSTENWNRPKAEVDHLMKLFRKYLKIDWNKKYPNVKFNMIGSYDRLPQDMIEAIENLKEKTKNNGPYIYNVALNYGGHDEILNAVNNILKSGAKSVTKEEFESYLRTKNQPPLDILIRTSGEQRVSNFMLWQLAYAELFFTKTYWPDFTVKELGDILVEFINKDRRFGKIKEDGEAK